MPRPTEAWMARHRARLGLVSDFVLTLKSVTDEYLIKDLKDVRHRASLGQEAKRHKGHGLTSAEEITALENEITRRGLKKKI